jgi:hypothetical protein
MHDPNRNGSGREEAGNELKRSRGVRRPIERDEHAPDLSRGSSGNEHGRYCVPRHRERDTADEQPLDASKSSRSKYDKVELALVGDTNDFLSRIPLHDLGARIGPPVGERLPRLLRNGSGVRQHRVTQVLHALKPWGGRWRCATARAKTSAPLGSGKWRNAQGHPGVVRTVGRQQDTHADLLFGKSDLRSNIGTATSR